MASSILFYCNSAGGSHVWLLSSVGEGEAGGAKVREEGAVWGVLAQRAALADGGDVGEDGEDALLEHLTGLPLDTGATIREARRKGGGAEARGANSSSRVAMTD